MESSFNAKRFVSGLIGVCILFVLIVWGWHYLHSGTIIITTNSSSPITLTKINSSGDDDSATQSSQSFTGHKRLSVRVSLGQYIAEVQGNSIGTTQLVKLTSHETLRYTINPINTTGIEPVAYQSAQDLSVGNNSLAYLDSTTKQLYRIDSQNNITAFGPAYTFQSVKWANSSFGIAQDNNMHLYVISNDTVRPLTPPQPYSPNTTVNYAVAPDEQIYVSFGSNVYIGNASGNFRKLYTSSGSQLGLTAGPSQVLVIQNISESAQNVVEVNNDGKAVSRDFDLGTVAWSPNGNYIASADEGGGTIYNTIKNTAVTIPNISQVSFINAVTWLNNSTLFYSSGSQVWVYNLNTQRSQLLANTPLANTATELALSPGNTYLYVLTGTGSGNTAIRRIGLSGQTVPSFIYQLQDIFPDLLNNYSMSLINFAGPPVILVQPYPDAPAGNYLQIASSQLQSLGFNVNNFQFQLTNAVIGQ